MTSKRLRYWFAAIAVLVGLAVFLWPRNGPTAFPSIPQPNGYNALVRAAGTLLQPKDSAKSSSTEQLAELSVRNQQGLASLREALRLPSAVPVQMSENWFTVHGPELTALKRAALTLRAEAELRLRRGDTNEAIRSYFDLMQLSAAAGKGGVLIDFLVSVACERSAVERFPVLIDGFDAAQCREVIRFLQEFDEQRDPFVALLKRENEWVKRTYSFSKRMALGIQERLNPNGGVSAIVSNQSDAYATAVRTCRNAALLAAVRVYRLERGKAPEQAADLVPAYLIRIPIDPTTGRPLELPSSNP